MASLTGRTRKIRHRKAARRGAENKKARASNGTTPKFPIHKDGKKNPPSKS